MKKALRFKKELWTLYSAHYPRPVIYMFYKHESMWAIPNWYWRTQDFSRVHVSPHLGPDPGC